MRFPSSSTTMPQQQQQQQPHHHGAAIGLLTMAVVVAVSVSMPQAAAGFSLSPLPSVVHVSPSSEHISPVSRTKRDNEEECGISNMGLPKRRILNGKDTIDGDWPWTVYLNSGCTGSIISSRHVLSAAHCAFLQYKDSNEFVLLKNITVILGSVRRGGTTSTSIGVVKTYVHPEYNYFDFSSPDLAVFELAHDIPFSRRIDKICLPTRFREHFGQIAVIVGWVGDIAQETFIPLNHPNDCITHLKNRSFAGNFDAKRFICGGGRMRGTEGGDSGGPLMVNEKGRWFQVGLTSFGETGGSQEDNYFDIGAYIRVAEHCPWISTVTGHVVQCIDMATAGPPPMRLHSHRRRRRHAPHNETRVLYR